MTATAARPSSAPTSPTPALAGSRTSRRIASIDIVRGLVVVLMAIDHVRVYSGQPAGGPTPGIFFTRWITHFVAPAFVFLAGTAAYLYGARAGDRRALSRFLVTRGLWLVVLELTVLRMAWTFNLDVAHYMLAGVIWMIGWCMVLLAGIIHLPMMVITVGSIAIIALHNVTDVFPGVVATIGGGTFGWLGRILYAGGAVPDARSGPLLILYVLVPWVAVMAAGFAFGTVMQLPTERRRTVCLRLGAALTAVFLLIRALDVYGDPRHWRPRSAAAARARPPAATPPSSSGAPSPVPAAGASQSVRPQPPRPQMPAGLAFLNTSKYPPSLLFLLMTLGPTLMLLGAAEHARGALASALETFGRVPFFFYMLHIPTIHFAAVVVSLVREGGVNPWLFENHPMGNGPPPSGYMWSLPLLYLVWAVVIAVLYVACRWYARVKATNRSPWLSYL